MKKQILFLSFLVLAVLASVTNSYGQIKNPNIRVWEAPECTATPLAPAAGELYSYTVEIPNTYAGYDGSGTFNWWVTQATNLLSAGDIITPGVDFSVDASGSVYNNTTGGAATIKIEWTAAAIASGQPYYLVVQYAEENTDMAAGCTVDNIKVYKIEPQNTFWLDINPTANATGTIPDLTGLTSWDICAPNVSGAAIQADGTVKYTYGISTLYAVITAGGYDGQWDAILKLNGFQDNQDIVSVSWADLGSGGTSGTFTADILNSTATDSLFTASLPSTVSPTNILVTIVVNNNQYEGLVDRVINIAIDGSYSTTVGATTTVFNDKSDWTDTDNDGGVDACVDEDSYADYINETLKARPGVNPAPATGTFVSDPTTRTP